MRRGRISYLWDFNNKKKKLFYTNEINNNTLIIQSILEMVCKLIFNNYHTFIIY